VDDRKDKRLAARVTIRGRLRRQFVLFAGLTKPEAKARTRALAEMAAQLRRAGLSDEKIENQIEAAALARTEKQWEAAMEAVRLARSGGGESARAEAIPAFKDFADEWTSGKLHKKHPDHVRLKDSENDVSRFKLYINEYLGGRRLDQITLSECDRVMANLPDGLSASSRRQVAQTIGRLMKLAVYPGRHIAASPIPRGWLPRPGKTKARGAVFPDEDKRMLGMGVPFASPIPLWRRFLWGFQHREGTRGPSEALSFRWRHLDLERGAVRLDKNKTDDPRVWALRPDVVRALLAWKKLTRGGTEPGDLVFVDENGYQPHETQLAAMYRDDMKAAGARAELFESNAHRLQLRAHDARAAFITVALANGKTETWVTDRTGHTTSGQLRNYRRAARTVEELGLGDWAPLDEAVPEFAPALPIDRPSPGSPPPNSGHDDRAIEHDFPVGARYHSRGPLIPLIGVRISAPEPRPSCLDPHLVEGEPRWTAPRGCATMRRGRSDASARVDSDRLLRVSRRRCGERHLRVYVRHRGSRWARSDSLVLRGGAFARTGRGAHPRERLVEREWRDGRRERRHSGRVPGCRRVRDPLELRPGLRRLLQRRRQRRCVQRVRDVVHVRRRDGSAVLARGVPVHVRRAVPRLQPLRQRSVLRLHRAVPVGAGRMLRPPGRCPVHVHHLAVLAVVRLERG
jgi:hypothetical protein